MLGRAQLGGPRCREAGGAQERFVSGPQSAVVLPLLTWHQLFSHFSHSCVHVVGVTCRILNPLHSPLLPSFPHRHSCLSQRVLTAQHRLQGAVHFPSKWVNDGVCGVNELPHDGGQGAGSGGRRHCGVGEILTATPHLPSDSCDGTDEYNSDRPENTCKCS